MYARSVALALLALPFLASAQTSGVKNTCNSGSVLCCNSVHSAKDADAAKLLKALNVDASQITGKVGVTCNPITVKASGSSGTACAVQTVCCENNSFKGVVALNCTPVKANT